MKFDYEFVRYQKGVPIKAYFVNIGFIDYHWHSDLELMWVLKGNVCVKIKNQEYRLNKGDIFIINPFEIHNLKNVGNDNLLLGIQIDIDAVEDFPFSLSGINFSNPHLHREQNNLQDLYRVMTDVMFTLESKQIESSLRTMSDLYLLLSILMEKDDYTILNKNIYKSKQKDIGRLKNIVSYINDHYNEKILLDQIADLCNISKYRASHYIKDKLGISYRQVVSRIRMKHALEQIINTNKTIIDIAQDCGFSEVKYLTAIIKQEFGLTPIKLRQSKNTRRLSYLNIDKDGHRPFSVDKGFELLKVHERN